MCVYIPDLYCFQLTFVIPPYVLYAFFLIHHLQIQEAYMFHLTLAHCEVKFILFIVYLILKVRSMDDLPLQTDISFERLQALLD